MYDHALYSAYNPVDAQDKEHVMSNQSIADSKKSMTEQKKRPVEVLVQAILDKNESYREEEVMKEATETRLNVTRILIKKLFRCTTLDEVDQVIHEANENTESFFLEYGKDEKGATVDFAMRIRNAELQVRDLIKAGKMQAINPDKATVTVIRNSSAALVDSWGHLAAYMMKGYEVKI